VKTLLSLSKEEMLSNIYGTRDIYLIKDNKDGTPFTNHVTIGTMSIYDGEYDKSDQNTKPFLFVGFVKKWIQVMFH
jgi:hypothetical protein